MKIDWHTHSDYSDGKHSLATLFADAKAAGITHLGVVDHDTTAHHVEGYALAKQYDMTFLAGVEISAYDFVRNRKVHLLGYGFTNSCPNIEALCKPLLARRHEHSLWQARRIQDAGFPLQLNDALAFSKRSGTLYKQHIMEALLSAPYDSKDYQTLYRALFKGSGVAAGDIVYINVFDALAAIHADGGVAVIAHPGQLDSFDVTNELIDKGLDGIEVLHPDHTEAHRAQALALAAQHGLFITGGSDFHGSYGAPVSLGQYTMDTLPQKLNSATHSLQTHT